MQKIDNSTSAATADPLAKLAAVEIVVTAAMPIFKLDCNKNLRNVL